MKKLFALTLAVAMVLSMASVAFASEKYYLNMNTSDLIKLDDHEIKFVGVNAVAEYGDTLYIHVTPSCTDDELVSLADLSKNFKIKADWSKNGSLVEGVSFVKELVIYDNVKQPIYYIAIETKEQPEETGDNDVIGTITIDPKSKNKVLTAGEGDEFKFDVAFNLDVKHAAPNDMTADDYYVHSFDEDEEYEIELYAGMGRFVVNTYGQDDIVIKTDVDYNEGIENVAPDANYVYFNSNNATFNRLGDLYLTADEDNFVYKVASNGQLVKIAPAYDEDEEAFVIRTRVIGNYVIAEEELAADALSANVEKAPEAPVAPVAPSNPSTGAAC